MAIRIGTDCSGIEAPIQALKQLKIKFRHVWSCEIDKYARQSILANYKPEIMYEDILTRNHSKLTDIDMYVCGFPCQSFSLMGKKLGTADKRSNIMLHCIKVIKTKKPKIFILENVKNFKFIENGAPFNYLISELNKIGGYNVYFEIFNTKDYGIPQNRERIFIFGIKKTIQKMGYSSPKKLVMKPLDSFIIDKTVCDTPVSISLKKNLSKIKINNTYKKNYIITPFSFSSIMKNVCPTLTLTSCKYMYHSTYKRYLTTKECLKLQGFSIHFINKVGDSHLCNQIGNSMSVNVLKALFKKIFTITKIN